MFWADMMIQARSLSYLVAAYRSSAIFLKYICTVLIINLVFYPIIHPAPFQYCVVNVCGKLYTQYEVCLF